MKTCSVTSFALTVLLASTSFAAFTIDYQSVVLNTAANTFDFTLDFSRTPDFTTADSFQYYIDYHQSPTSPPMSDIDIVIRGSEIGSSSTIPVRDGIGLYGGPDAGGWGPIRDSVPFTLTNDVLTFSVDIPVIGDPDNNFSYAIGLYEDDQKSDWLYRQDLTTSSVPTPSAILLAGIGVALISRYKNNKA